MHVIFSYKGKNHLINKEIRCKDDVLTHLYTLIVKPDNTYEVLIDNEKVESGELEADWNFLPPKKIKDPEAKKPEDWDDRATIDDPNDTKPDVSYYSLFCFVVFIFILVPFVNLLFCRIGISQSTFQILMLLSQKTGMMKWMVNGSHPRLTIQITRVNGNQNRLTIQHTK